MSYTSQVREELCRVEAATPGEVQYELRGAYLACGDTIATRHAAVARRLLSLARRFPERFGEVNMLKNADGRFGAGTLYTISLEKPIGHLPEPETSEHAAAIARGAFLCRGSVSSPESRCQLGIVLPDENSARELQRAVQALEAAPGISLVRGKWTLYLKSGEMIAELLGRMGAQNAYLEIEAARVMKEMRAEVNRQVNFDNANLAKQARASARQIHAIEKIQKTIGLDKIPDALGEIAVLRYDNPDASLEELGAMCNPPSGKSGVNSRMRRLLELAEKLPNA